MIKHTATVCVTILEAGLILAAPSARAAGAAWISSDGSLGAIGPSYPNLPNATRRGPGQYTVTFQGLGDGLHSNVQVNAYFDGAPPSYCTTVGWYSPNGSDVEAFVNCYAMSGVPQDNPFVVFYQTRSAKPPVGAVAFLLADQPSAAATYAPAASFSYNSVGGTNTVTRYSPGSYLAYLQGLTKTGGNVQVTAYAGHAERCEIAGWSVFNSGTYVSVLCVDATGAPADSIFSLAYTIGATEAVGTSATLGGYAWADQPNSLGSYIPAPAYNFQYSQSPFHFPAPPVVAQPVSVGQSWLSMSAANTGPGTEMLGMVTAVGVAGEFCVIEGADDSALWSDCYDKNGNPVNTQYSATFMGPPNQ